MVFTCRNVFKRQVKCVLIAASFRPEQPFFRWYGGVYRRILPQFHHVFVQNKADKQLLAQHGIKAATVAGDPRADRVLEIAQSHIDIPLISTFAANNKVLIAGSTWPPDEDFLLEKQTLWTQDWKLLIAPHDIGAFHIQQITKQLRIPYCRFSDAPDKDTLQQSRILILDTIGLLSQGLPLWRCSLYRRRFWQKHPQLIRTHCTRLTRDF
ncbi:MAG: glycosyltransferase N-terminal domain-containing protein [Saprospiraceae bacterium]